MEFRKLLREIRHRPGMYFGRSELPYEKLTAFVLGVDYGTGGGLLHGFREFLILRLGEGSSLSWEGLIHHLAGSDGHGDADPPVHNHAAVACLSPVPVYLRFQLGVGLRRCPSTVDS